MFYFRLTSSKSGCITLPHANRDWRQLSPLKEILAAIEQLFVACSVTNLLICSTEQLKIFFNSLKFRNALSSVLTTSHACGRCLQKAAVLDATFWLHSGSYCMPWLAPVIECLITIRLLQKEEDPTKKRETFQQIYKMLWIRLWGQYLTKVLCCYVVFVLRCLVDNVSNCS